jgi:hypothetical protein
MRMQQVFGRLQVLVLHLFKKAECIFFSIIEKCLGNLLQRIGGFAHGRNHNQQLFILVGLEDVSQVPDPFYAVDRGAAEFENFHATG